MDIKQNLTTGYLDLVDNDLTQVTGIEAIGQDITRSIRVIKREWFRDQSLGIDYYNEIFAKGVSLALIESRFREAILNVPGVLRLINFRLEADSETRNLTLQIDSIETEEGSFPYSTGVGV